MADRRIIDARQMIGGPSWPCPSCELHEFGTLSISDRRIVRRCRRCLHTASEPLPAPRRRRVVYLDQFVFSNMAKTLDPVWRAERGQQAEIWSRIFDGLDRALKLHLIVCPESLVHEEESVVSSHFDMLQRLYEHFAAGTRFASPTHVHEVQLRVALQAKLAGLQPNFSAVAQEDVVSGRLATWMERISIKVQVGTGRVDPAATRVSRANLGTLFEALFERWARERPTFEQAYEMERPGFADATVQHLRDHFSLHAKVALGSAEPSEELWNYRQDVGVALGLVRLAEESGLLDEDPFKFAVGFLHSEEALSAPANEIGSLLMAGLAQHAVMGQKRIPSRGMWNDITAISAFLPYCDAMFLDDECAHLLSEGPIRRRLLYPTRIFSTRTAEEFVVYLHGLEREAGDEWARLIMTIYGEEWVTPFRTILVKTRERERERRTEAGQEPIAE